MNSLAQLKNGSGLGIIILKYLSVRKTDDLSLWHNQDESAQSADSSI